MLNQIIFPITASHHLDKKIDDNNKILTTIPYAEAVGSLIFSMICTRPNLAYSISILNRENQNFSDIKSQTFQI